MSETGNANWKNLYRIGGVAALLAVLISIVEIGITFLPGGTAEAASVVDWFTLFQSQPFMGLRNMGLLNMGFNATAIPAYLALYAAHRKANRHLAALATIIALLGVAVFFSTNRAFPMLDLSQRYAVATTEVQRAYLVAAGQAMLSMGGSHTPGTFLAFFFAEVAGILISIVMLRGRVFSRVNAYSGILGFSILLASEILASFVWGLDSVTMLLAMIGGLFSMAWYVLLALRLFRLKV